ncbi:MAG: hypothetical protein H0V34_14415 [Gammaproteobacteria bacterium]|nr:hypothetical protein [Gammaproteobacteria bacterium]
MDFPLDLRFKLLAIAQQISVTDAAGRVIFYVRQKAFRLREAVSVYGDTAQNRPLYHINADRVFDISTQYHIDDARGARLGAVRRRGMRSLWRAHYDIMRNDQPFLVVREENPWVKVLDGLLDSIPVIGMFTGYVLHPSYLITRVDNGAAALRVTKQPAFFEGRYRIERLDALDEDAEQLAVLALLMMLLLERQRG